MLRHWNPIGISGEPEARSEYDAYVGGVYRLLASGAPDRDIARHLRDVETRALGFEDSNVKMLIPVARELRKVYRRLASEAPSETDAP